MAALPLHAAADDRARVTALADRYVAEYRKHFPLSYAFSGLPVERNDGIDINSAADIARWRALMKSMGGELATIKPDGFAGEPEWVTWQFLDQAFRQDAMTAICRNELWSVSPLGWQAGLPQVAGIQPVGTDEARAQALTRWRAFGPYIDREIANLRDGQRLGYSASDVAVGSTLSQLDELLAMKPGESPLMEPATRDKTPAFAADWRAVIEGTVWPAIVRYRDYIRDEYLPRARKSPSLQAMPDGRDCYRSLIFSTATVDVDPDALFDRAQREVERERKVAVELGRKLFGDKVTDWKSLGEVIRADPREKFASADEVRDFTQRVYERANAAASRMVLTPPVGKVVLEPFPEFQQATAPGGQYLPAAEDGSRPATYLYRNVTTDLYRTSLENVILHETLPGHHLQVAFLAEQGRKGNHPVARLLFFSGPGEGWATYAEDFAYELGLYSSDRDYIGRYMSSITPWIVLDLGMQVKGWTMEQAMAYAIEARPLRSPEQVKDTVAFISSAPGFVIAYPLGGLKWQEMRARAEKALGDRFDVRAFHQALLEDGMLPFSALEAKLDRWIASR
ncbi:MAG TPA: DUF885 domain-containing protein [Steroidobacteraceae bacterium]|nr:DUF885 domain-containing protein [Steroidobacteraceae bacterium]